MRNRLHKSFIHDGFLLQTEFARSLYDNYAKNLPIIDYHNHLAPELIVKDHKFENLTQAWLYGDHYKWRAMRTYGIDENFITGDASDADKFEKWAATVPYTIRNPLYHWSHLELKRYFGIDHLISVSNHKEIYHKANTLLKDSGHTTQGLLRQMRVEVLCTTDDPIDSLENHEKAGTKDMGFEMLPAFRPDKAYTVEDSVKFLDYIEQLGSVSGVTIKKYEDVLEALGRRMDHFHEKGCRLSDHGLEYIPYYWHGTFDIDQLFKKIKDKKSLSPDEIGYFKCETLKYLCKGYHKRGWVQQFHLGAFRNTNTRMLRNLGPDTGYDSIGDFQQATSLGLFMDHLDTTDQLAKTILYNLNPSDNEVMATMIGNFNDGSVKGKIQFGSAWWFLDQKDGMEKQLNSLSNMGLLSCFIGMLTDSRSFLSFPRHEYFRRILCNLIGNDVAAGILPADEKWLGKIVSDISYHNAKNYFNF